MGAHCGIPYGPTFVIVSDDNHDALVYLKVRKDSRVSNKWQKGRRANEAEPEQEVFQSVCLSVSPFLYPRGSILLTSNALF
jgi:hypothetical protein